MYRLTVRSLFLAGAFAGLTALDPGVATASDPFALYAVPTKVEMLPNDVTATRVVIHGAVLFLSMTRSSGAEAVYTEPKCGKMYFECPGGEEDLCRMQWQDLRNAIDKGYCAGFGTLNMLSTATLHPEDDATARKPDLWEMGMGVAMAGYLGGQCPKARTLQCPASTVAGPGDGGGGAGGRAGAGSGHGDDGAGGSGVTTGSGGSATATGGTPSGTGGAPIATGGSSDGGGGQAVSGQGPVQKPGSGCTIAGTAGLTTDVALFVAAFVVGAIRGRPRKKG